MVLSKRERYIGLVAGLVVGLLLLDKVMVGPLLEQREGLAAQIKVSEADMKKATDLIDLSGRANRNWASVSPNVPKDATEAQSELLHNVRDWASEAGLNFASINPQRAEREKDFQKLTFRATATGSLGQIGRFLYKIQNATMPVRITDLSISSHGREGNDDLSLSVAIATIYMGPQTEGPR